MQQLNNSTNDTDSATCADLLIDVVPVVMAALRAQSVLVKPAELSIAQFRAAALLHRYPGQSLSKLAEFLGLSLSSVSKLVDGLVGMGYVRHEVCPEDRRRAHLYLSPKGQSMFARTRAAIARVMAAQLETSTPEARCDVAEGLRQLQAIFARVD